MKVESASIQFSTNHEKQSKRTTNETLLAGTTRGGFSRESLDEGVYFSRSTEESSESRAQTQLFIELAKASETRPTPSTIQQLVNGPLQAGGEAIQRQSAPETPVTAIPDLISAPIANSDHIEDEMFEATNDLRFSLMKSLVEQLTGKEVETIDPHSLEADVDSSNTSRQIPGQAATTTEPPTPEFGLRYHYDETYTETETTQVNARGIINTADGKSIEIDLSLMMSREFQSRIDINIRTGAALKDPIILNFAGNSAQVTEKSFAFDLDVDGETDSLRVLGANSAYLAYDKNNDGRINNGSELFGAISGDGFADLRLLDDDGNGVLDESDSAFSSLSVYRPDETGNAALENIQAVGIAAIILDSAATPFEIKNDQNELSGQVRATGIYLNENGEVDTLQQVDLVV